jgi:OOP family OmpA-OmpF porin
MSAARIVGLVLYILAATIFSDPAVGFSPYLVLFESGQAEINAAAKPVINQVISDAKRYPGTPIVLLGHTDRVGSDHDNAVLSQRRAEAVRAALVAGGVPAGLITVQGMGEGEPAIPTDDGVAELANRRVEILFSDLNPGAPPDIPAK